MDLPIQVAPVRRSSIDGLRANRLQAQDICVTASIENGKVCINLPLLGKKCFSVPGLPAIGSAQVCCDPSFFPPGATCCVSVGGLKLGCVSV